MTDLVFDSFIQEHNCKILDLSITGSTGESVLYNKCLVWMKQKDTFYLLKSRSLMQEISAEHHYW